MRATDALDDLASVHRSTIEALAADSHAPIDFVEKLYRSECTNLEPNARIRLYLPVIVRRRVRDALSRQRQSVIPAPQG
jgi:hypothetical protein